MHCSPGKIYYVWTGGSGNGRDAFINMWRCSRLSCVSARLKHLAFFIQLNWLPLGSRSARKIQVFSLFAEQSGSLPSRMSDGRRHMPFEPQHIHTKRPSVTRNRFGIHRLHRIAVNGKCGRWLFLFDMSNREPGIPEAEHSSFSFTIYSFLPWPVGIN